MNNFVYRVWHITVFTDRLVALRPKLFTEMTTLYDSRHLNIYLVFTQSRCKRFTFFMSASRMTQAARKKGKRN